MRYPYAETRKFFLSELKKEEKKWKSFIAHSEANIARMKDHLEEIDENDKYYNIYQDTIDDTQRSMLKATEELESVRRNMDSIKEL